MNKFKLERICTIMEPEAGNANEAEGVLNPAAIRGQDGELYLFPRLVAKNNYSRIGIAKVLFDKDGEPTGVERLGIALAPEAPYEKRSNGGGGCEDARVSFVEILGRYVMTYTAFGPDGPRIAAAYSHDLLKWTRIGLVEYLPFKNIDFNDVDDKDACTFPILIPSPHNHGSLAMLHRPLFPGTSPDEMVKHPKRKPSDETQSIWISYCNLKPGETVKTAEFTSHHLLAMPEADWEKVKIGAGAPPILTKHGWLLVYHGVREFGDSCQETPKFCYSAGAMVLSVKNPQKILYRSKEPILEPELEDEKIGTIGNVVFPTGTDRRDDLGQPERIDVYYGMADNRIGVAKMIVPDEL
ncbi:putative GH43/DUF377 family glycosyl hydrolase [Pedobacter sp. UYP30]|uniref:glycoside hydrolase family 130 protein n=1 Tax=Pedobacter sp. UYP30 TaxID=1756400 RepID=UPI0033941A62